MTGPRFPLPVQSLRAAARAVLFALATLLAAMPAGAAAQAPVTVFAAASLRGPLDTVIATWQSRSGHRARIVYGGSAVLARQLENGAPGTVFISANEAWMDTLERGGLLAPGTRFDWLSNRLALVCGEPRAHAGTLTGEALAALVGDGRIATALIEAVPAGLYGKAALQSLGVFERLLPQIVQAEDVRGALALVARGEAECGIVYVTDARLSASVHIVAIFPQETHPPIRYPAAILADSDGPAARSLLAHLRASDTAATLAAHGFRVLGP